MTRQETLKVLSLVRFSYPNAYRGMTDNDIKMAVKLWEGIFKDYTYKDVYTGVTDFIASDTKGFPPVVGQVKALIDKRANPEISGTDAWGLVLKAMRNAIHNSEEEFKALPKGIQKAVGSPVQLKLWAINTDMKQMEFVKRGFIKDFEEVKESGYNGYNDNQIAYDEKTVSLLDIANAELRKKEAESKNLDKSEMLENIQKLKEKLSGNREWSAIKKR